MSHGSNSVPVATSMPHFVVVARPTTTARNCSRFVNGAGHESHGRLSHVSPVHRLPFWHWHVVSAACGKMTQHPCIPQGGDEFVHAWFQCEHVHDAVPCPISPGSVMLCSVGKMNSLPSGIQPPRSTEVRNDRSLIETEPSASVRVHGLVPWGVTCIGPFRHTAALPDG